MSEIQNRNGISEAQIDQIGEALAMGVTVLLLKSVAAGITKGLAAIENVGARAEGDLADAKRQAADSRMMNEVDRIEKEKKLLRSRIARAAKGSLKHLTLRKRLADLTVEEDRLCGEVIRATPVEAPATVPAITMKAKKAN